MDHPARLTATVAGLLLGLALLVGCGLASQPVVTRLPPAPSTSSTPLTTPTATPSATPPVSVPLSPTPSTPVATTPPGDASVIACGGGGTASITGAERSVRVEGTCAQLTVSGSALTVDATAATIGALAMSGDRLRVTAAGVDTATIQGNDTALAVAGTLGRLDLSGDRATVSAGGAVDSVLVRGQDNAVTAGGGIGDSTVEGRGNRVG